MNRRILPIVALLLSGMLHSQDLLENEVAAVLDEWHRAAAMADFEGYFDKMTEDAVFIGTDATEYWKGASFRNFSKPYFDRGKAWNFTAVERHIYISGAGDIAWFDELLDTQMKLCRGSGVLKKTGGSWKITHYVLSIAVPNDKVPELIRLKQENDSLLLLKLGQH